MVNFSSPILRALLLAGLPLGAALAQTTPGVGIGTTTPNAQLHVESNLTSQPQLLLRNPTGGASGTVNFDIQTYNPGTNASNLRLQALGNNYSADLLFWTKQPGAAANSLVERLRLTGLGYLGIGTSSPNAPLTVQATSGGALLGFFTSAGADKYNFSLTNGGLNLSESNVAAGRLFVQNGGNVGIGTTSPGYKLDVSGTARSTNAIVTTALTGNGADVGSSVIGVGIRADGGLNLGQNTTGNIVSLGYSAGLNNTGNYNTFVGYQAGRANTTGGSNTFNGFNSGFANTTGANNTFGGFNSGFANTTSANNTFNGYSSGYSTTTGGSNTFSGSYSGFYNTTGANNAFLGYVSGAYNITGSNLTALGYGSGPAVDGLTNATAVGAGATLRQSNTVILGDGTASVGIGTSTPGYKLDVQGGDINASGSVRSGGNVITSDARFKTDVRPLGGALASVLALRGVRYHWNALGVQHGGQAGAEQVGLLAQELEKVYPELVSTGPDGYKAVNYAQLAPVLIEALKEQQAQIETLKAQNAAATQRAARAEASLGSFEQRLRALEAGGAQAQASK